MNRTQYILFTLIPCSYFMLLGIFDIGMDALHGTLCWLQVLFNIVFVIPILFRRGEVHLLLGIIFTLLWGYFLLAGTVLYATADKPPYPNSWQTFGAGMFLFFSFICSICLMIGGGLWLNEEAQRKSRLAA